MDVNKNLTRLEDVLKFMKGHGTFELSYFHFCGF